MSRQRVDCTQTANGSPQAADTLAAELERIPEHGPVLLITQRSSRVEAHLGWLLSTLLTRRPDLMLIAQRQSRVERLRRPQLPWAGADAWLRQGHALLAFLDESDEARALTHVAEAMQAKLNVLHICEEKDRDGNDREREGREKRSQVRLWVGAPLLANKLDEHAGGKGRIAYLLSKHAALGARSRGVEAGPRQASFASSLVAPVAPELLEREVAQLTKSEVLVERSDVVVAMAPLRRIPRLFDEIARLRELSFRSVGEGTGQAEDRDRFDEDYLHLFVYNRSERSVQGAYRLGLTDEILRKRGPGGLYTTTLFEFEPETLRLLSPSIELGRSFVRPECQRSSKTLLWLLKGIAVFVMREPRFARLFGPVSISADYTEFSRKLIAATFGREPFAHALSSGVTPKRPLDCSEVDAYREAVSGGESLSAVICDAESDAKGLPVLVKEYMRLGGRFLGFSVDPEFSDVVDGLVVVDLRETEERLLSFYMTKPGYRQFTDRHKALSDEYPELGVAHG